MSNIPKPIFLIGLPRPDMGVSRQSHQAWKEFLEQTQSALIKKFDDYHVLVYEHPGNEPKFQVFYEKDFNKVKYEELKQIVIDSVNQCNAI